MSVILIANEHTEAFAIVHQYICIALISAQTYVDGSSYLCVFQQFAPMRVCVCVLTNKSYRDLFIGRATEAIQHYTLVMTNTELMICLCLYTVYAINLLAKTNFNFGSCLSMR